VSGQNGGQFKLGLDGLIDYLYSPLDDDVPPGVDARLLRFYEEGHYTFHHTVHRHTPMGEFKPNPHNLRTIMEHTGASAQSTAYVGDSLFKDVPMAQDCGVLDFFAEYGKAQHREEYELLRRVIHWTDADVQRERELYQRPVQASVTLAHGFYEMLNYVLF
jgi:phosphoglycolate phosphatase-like HAD superfamily hydrolase